MTAFDEDADGRAFPGRTTRIESIINPVSRSLGTTERKGGECTQHTTLCPHGPQKHEIRLMDHDTIRIRSFPRVSEQ